MSTKCFGKKKFWPRKIWVKKNLNQFLGGQKKSEPLWPQNEKFLSWRSIFLLKLLYKKMVRSHHSHNNSICKPCMGEITYSSGARRWERIGCEFIKAVVEHWVTFYLSNGQFLSQLFHPIHRVSQKMNSDILFTDVFFQAEICVQYIYLPDVFCLHHYCSKVAFNILMGHMRITVHKE